MLSDKLNDLIDSDHVKPLSEYLKCSDRSIYLWRKGDRKPDYEKLVKIANYYNVSTDYLLGNDKKDSKKEKELYERDILKNVLIKAGYMKKEEKLTDEELDKIMKFVTINKDFIKGYNKYNSL